MLFNCHFYLCDNVELFNYSAIILFSMQGNMKCNKNVMKWCTLLSTLSKYLNKLDNMIFWKTYFSMTKSVSVTDFHL